jgi:hypothetical protein
MNHLFDEFSKSLAESVPRRESLRRLGAVFAGAVLSPLAAGTAWAAGKRRPGQDPCTSFCRCSNKSDQNACLATCRACSGDTKRLCGSCGMYHCADLAQDPYNCGACGNVCSQGNAGPNAYGVCINSSCQYYCIDGAVRCNGACTFLDSDSDNCGACGDVCPESAPYCLNRTCTCAPWQTRCGNACVDLDLDPANCGACGVQCAASETCVQGLCGECAPGLTWCGGYCADLMWDQSNCGACGHYCDPNYEVCSGGYCYCPNCVPVPCDFC